MQAFKQIYLCLSAQTYRIEQEDGEVIEGISIKYVPDNNLTARENPQAYERGHIERGIKTAKFSLPIAAKTQLNVFPALYEFEMELVSVAEKLQVRPKSIEFSSAVKLVPEKG